MAWWSLITLNVVVGGITSACSDMITQKMELHFLGYLASDPAFAHPQEPQQESQQIKQANESDSDTKKDTSLEHEVTPKPAGYFARWDKHRTVCFFLASLPVALSQFGWYTVVIPKLIPGVYFTDVLLTTTIDETLGSYIIPLLLVGLTIVHRQPCSHLIEKLREDFWPMFVWSTVITFPFEIVVFSAVPAEYQTIFNTLVYAVVNIIQSYYGNRVLQEPEAFVTTTNPSVSSMASSSSAAAATATATAITIENNNS